MSDATLLWGDLHTHLDVPNGDEVLAAARDNIDFCAALLYPFDWEWADGFRVETTGNRVPYPEHWQRLQALAHEFDEAGRFVVFPGYEWHGNRSRWGDHNVIHLDGGGELDDSWELADLFAVLRERRAFALPHHTGYAPGQRSKDWSLHDGGLSPVMEVFSWHGSCEGIDTPHPMEANGSMGPRASGGTLHDALARGIRIGLIGSNDGDGLPGRWGCGRAAVWSAPDGDVDPRSRAAVWEALAARRTYAVTGDRIELDVQVEGATMGSETRAGSHVDVDVDVRGSAAVDRIELLRDGIVIDTYCHGGDWEAQQRRVGVAPGRHKLRVEAGWGPVAYYGFGDAIPEGRWRNGLRLDVGRLVGVERCFSHLGNRVVQQADDSCQWQLCCAPRHENNTYGMTQALVFEIDGGTDTTVHLDMDGETLTASLTQLAGGAGIVPLLEESRDRVRDVFGRVPDSIGNPDALYHNARKVKLHRAVPEAAYAVEHTFGGVAIDGTQSLYVRVSQRNGQLAWSSPLWVEAG